MSFLCECMLNCNLFLWSKLYFQHHYCSLQCHMIFRNADLLLNKHFWLLSMLKTVVLHNIFVETVMHYFFRIHRWIESSKDQHLLETEIFCNFMNAFIIAFEQFNVSLMNKSLKTYHKLLYGGISWFPQKHFNIDNNQKCFLSSKSAYYNDFWRSCDTEDWRNDAENTDLITEINYSLTDIHIENSYFKL